MQLPELQVIGTAFLSHQDQGGLCAAAVRANGLQTPACPSMEI
jgi:hypothetical protein